MRVYLCIYNEIVHEYTEWKEKHRNKFPAADTDFDCLVKTWSYWILHPQYARPSSSKGTCLFTEGPCYYWKSVLLAFVQCMLRPGRVGVTSRLRFVRYARRSSSETRCSPVARSSTVYASVFTSAMTSSSRRTAPSGDRWNTCLHSCWEWRWVAMTTMTSSLTSCDVLTTSWRSYVDKVSTRLLFSRLLSFLLSVTFSNLNFCSVLFMQRYRHFMTSRLGETLSNISVLE